MVARVVRGIVAALFLCQAAASGPAIIPWDRVHGALTLVNTTSHGKLFRLAPGGPAGIPEPGMHVLHLWGNATDAGRAQGLLIGGMIRDFLENDLPAFYRDEVSQLAGKLQGLPEWLQRLILSAGRASAPDVFAAALDYVRLRERTFMRDAAAAPLDEMAAMADAVCSGGSCDAKKMTALVERTNMLPELIRMTCTILGAWGEATADGNLVQLRALDFGTGPFANHSFLTVYHPDVGNAHALLGFPSMVGAITGWNEHVALSEKVWETYDGSGVQPGSYDGQAVVSVLRDILQTAGSKEEAEARARGAARTWSILLGVGDAQEQRLDVLGYKQSGIGVYNDTTVGAAITGFDAIPDVAMVDKHPQPSHDATTMPTNVRRLHGKLSAETVATDLVPALQSGDLHAAVYDFAHQRVLLAIGSIDAAGNYTKQAWEQQFMEFSMRALWDEARPVPGEGIEMME